MSLEDELDCKAVSRFLSEGHDRTLPPQERARLRLHLVICDACRNVDAQFTFLRDAMKKLGRDVPPKN
jgi:predicted anti-sigma-YlaC factor YlaD